MSNENLNGNSEDESIRPPENTVRVGQAIDHLSNNQIQHTKKLSEDFFKDLILKSIPKESQITNIRFEGPYVALYTLNPKFSLTELTYYLSSLSKNVKKRFVVRTDPSIRLSEEETRSAVIKMLPSTVTISAVFCDDATGEVVLEVNHPESVDANMVITIAQATGWIAHTLRSPHIQSSSMNIIHSAQKGSAKERSLFLQSLGKRVFRPPVVLESEDLNLNYTNQSNKKKSEYSDLKSNVRNREEILIFCLGGVKQVGRSCFIVVTSESKIMLDCGINPGEPLGISGYPRLDWFNFNLDEIDAVVISHAHIDHQGFLPTLFKFGYKGPVYCTEPTLPLMTLLQYDSVKISKSNGTFLPYETRDVNEVIKHCITLPYGKPTDISPDITITFNNAGHIMGSATVHINIFGTHNILYSGDYKYARTQLLDSAVSVYPRVETLITESTYGNSSDIMPDQSLVYKTFTDTINRTLTAGGKVLIPVPAVGRAQEIMLVLDKEMREGRLMEAPVFIEGMISEASAIHMSYAHYLGFDVRKSVSNGVNPFQSEYFTVVNGYERRQDVFNDENPSVIMATSGMLEGGPSVEYFKKIAPDKKNSILFVSYQINGTLGRRVIDGGITEISMLEQKGKVKVFPIKCTSQKIDGFSGHSDFNQIMNFTARIKPKKVLVNHGERSKSDNVASNIFSRFKIRATVPDNREIIKLR